MTLAEPIYEHEENCKYKDWVAPVSVCQCNCYENAIRLEKTTDVSKSKLNDGFTCRESFEKWADEHIELAGIHESSKLRWMWQAWKACWELQAR